MKPSNSTSIPIVSTASQSVSQFEDAYVTMIPFDHYTVRYGYARSSDSRRSNTKSQDYLAFRADATQVAFVVCDGVGQSFFGDIAARIVGENLVDWLWSAWRLDNANNQLDRIEAQSHFQKEVSDFLLTLVEPAKNKIKNHPLKPGLHAITIDALEGMRLEGSETTVVCGFIRLPNLDLPTGSVFLAWGGNSKVWLYDEQGLRTDHTQEANFDNKHHWSSERGLSAASPLQTWAGSFHAIGRVCAYTDGLDKVADRLQRPLSLDALQTLVKEESEFEGSDDISIFEVITRHGLIPEPDPIRLESPKLELVFGKKAIRVEWLPVPEADAYEVERNWGEEYSSQGKQKVVHVDLLLSRGLKDIKLRVRALNYDDKRVSEWAECQYQVPAQQGISVPQLFVGLVALLAVVWAVFLGNQLLSESAGDVTPTVTIKATDTELSAAAITATKIFISTPLSQTVTTTQDPTETPLPTQTTSPTANPSTPSVKITPLIPLTPRTNPTETIVIELPSTTPPTTLTLTAIPTPTLQGVSP